MKNMKWILLVSIVASCTNIKVKNEVNEIREPNTKEIVKFKYVPKEIEIFNGKVKYVEFETDFADGANEITCPEGDKVKKIPIYIKNKKASFYMAENYFSKATGRKCFLKEHHVLNLKISQFGYKREKLNVTKRHIDISKKNLNRHLKEKKIRAKVYQDTVPYYMFEGAFQVPLNSFITSHYGNQRIFNNKKKSQHLGNDLRAKVGVPIPVANRGRVVFVGDWFFSGKLVIVDHGLGLFTNYMHLSKIKVTKGSVVNKGDIIGLAGMTGRVSGPHLHWGVKINGNNVDGFSLVKESEKHFALNESAK